MGGDRGMKKLEAIIKPYKLEEVRDALTGLGIDGMTVSEVRGYGRWGYGPDRFKEPGWSPDAISQLKIEVVLRDKVVGPALDAVLVAAKTGKAGDGKVFIVPVESALRIRTGERNSSAV